jgi:predicted AlkP superfamily pyrophosphatase or phosphodiesterase
MMNSLFLLSKTKIVLLIYTIFLLKSIEGHNHSKKPLLLLISFDGFRWDYLDMYNLTNFNSLREAGSYAQYIRNTFATITFPNHWTIVTGLYEETHGIVQNEMYDPSLNKSFNFTNEKDQTAEWFRQNKNTEPIWITNQKNGDDRLSAAEWVGSGVKYEGVPIISIPYNHSRPYKDLIDQFIGLFTSDKPINFGALYFDEPDHTGHVYGPYSTQMKEKLQELDNDLGYLVKQLQDHHLFDKLNVIITSDHGMESISKEKAIFLDDHIDTSLFNAYGSRAVYNIFVKNGNKHFKKKLL